MNIAQVEESIKEIILSGNKQEFIYNFLLAYDLPKASITRLKKGSLNLSKKPDEIVWKKKLFYKQTTNEDLYEEYSKMIERNECLAHEPRFIILTNFEKVLARDTKTLDTLDIKFNDLAKYFDFFLPWAGMEKAMYKTDNPADVKAAEKMAKLYDQLKQDNNIVTQEKIHELNIFLSRLLFCFFAEDTDIFPKGIFTNLIESHTQTDGSDLNSYINRLFKVLNLPTEKRGNLPSYLDEFPYVNGKLFEAIEITLEFSRKSRQAILDCGSLDWSLINPDIFGSMIQAVVTPEYRGSMGMHYTSVPNIMKVIHPLFLDDLYLNFEKSKGNVKSLNELLQRITTLKIFDPACGSGNFLIIAYKEIRKLEMLILNELNKLEPTLYLSTVTLDQFYGIEIDDFAHEIAILSLWLAEHQMNREFLEKFGRTNPTLPLKASGNIVHANSTRTKWELVCPKSPNEEVYILGNPPYLGARLLSPEQKKDMEIAFDNSNIKYSNLDYIASWFFKGTKFIRNRKAMFAFVSTNSITQGEQVGLLWPYIFNQGLEIGFAYKSFKWTNNAKSQAAVICVICGVQPKGFRKEKFLFDKELKHQVSNISPYLIEGDNLCVTSKNSPIMKHVPNMVFGSMANDGGHLILNEDEYQEIILEDSNNAKFIKVLLGSREFINGEKRYCIWVDENKLNGINQSSLIWSRIEAVKKYRQMSKREATRKLSAVPFRFGEVRHQSSEAIIIPRVSSENRDYIPVGYLDENTVISDSALAIYNAEPWIFGILTSRLHMVWVKNVGGRLKSDYRYSASLCYNTFPFIELTNKAKLGIEKLVFKILEIRENFPEKSLAFLYHKETMPNELLDAHLELDKFIDSCYRTKPFMNDDERIQFLFKLYNEII